MPIVPFRSAVGTMRWCEMTRQTQQADHAARQVDGEKVERVHQRDPDEHSQRERRNESAVAVDHRLRLILDHFNQHFDRALKTARHAGRRLARSETQHEDGDETAHDRPEQRIEIPDVDVENRRLMSGGKILQVVRNVLGRIQSARSFASCHIVNATQIVENLPGRSRRNTVLREHASAGLCPTRAPRC